MFRYDKGIPRAKILIGELYDKNISLGVTF